MTLGKEKACGSANSAGTAVPFGCCCVNASSLASAVSASGAVEGAAGVRAAVSAVAGLPDSPPETAAVSRRQLLAWGCRTSPSVNLRLTPAADGALNSVLCCRVCQAAAQHAKGKFEGGRGV